MGSLYGVIICDALGTTAYKGFYRAFISTTYVDQGLSTAAGDTSVVVVVVWSTGAITCGLKR